MPILPLDAPGFASELGQTIRRERRRQKLTQEELALLAGVTPRTLGKLEAGHETIRLDSVISVVRALGLRVSITSGAQPEH
jgi:y4mF family transcriptional regulator